MKASAHDLIVRSDVPTRHNEPPFQEQARNDGPRADPLPTLEDIMRDSDLALAGTPYLIGQDDAAKRRYRSLLETSTALREQALASNERIRDEANELLEPYLNAIRTELVAESKDRKSVV